eukprot:7106190-Ditylum_brightwellii.AAC.1
MRARLTTSINGAGQVPVIYVAIRDFVDSARRCAYERYKTSEEVDNVDGLEMIPECLTVVGWLDSAMDQLAAVCQSYKQCMTGSKQSSDTGDSYKVIKYEELTANIDDVPKDTLTVYLELLFLQWSRENEVMLGQKKAYS